MKICKSCVLPVNFPHITFASDGACNLCRSYKGSSEAGRLKKEYKDKFELLLKKIASKGAYDILVCYSGGKDSTYVLSVFKEMYGLKILAFTFDNGFIPERTFINIRNAIERLDVDHIFFKPRFNLLKKIFREAVKGFLYPMKAMERASLICTSCIGLVKYTALKLAIEKEIPFVGFGWSPGQAPVTSSILKINPRMVKSMEDVIKRPIVEVAGKEMEGYFLNERHYSKPDKFPIYIHPLAFLKYDEKAILNKVKKLGWIEPRGLDLNSTNCYLNSFANAAHKRRYGFHPYVFEIAALVREGCMSREEGLRRIRNTGDRKTIEMVKRRLAI